MKLRMTHAARKAGLSHFEACDKAEEAVRESGLLGLLGGIKAMSGPDGGLVTNIYTYAKHIRSKYHASLTDLAASKLNDEAIAEIEAHRSKAWPGSSDYPRDFEAYCYYRTALEIRLQFGISSEDMGFDPGMIHILVQLCLTNLRASEALEIMTKTKRALRGVGTQAFSTTIPTSTVSTQGHDQDFLTAAVFFPDLDNHITALKPFGGAAQAAFRTRVIAEKKFRQAAQLREEIIAAELLDLFGPEAGLQNYGRRLLETGQAAKAKGLREALRVLGGELSADEIIEKLESNLIVRGHVSAL